MSLRILWHPSAERDLIVGVARWETIMSIDAAVTRVAASYEAPSLAEPIERFGDHPCALRLRVPGRRVVTMLVDAQERILVVLSVRAEPDPDAGPNADAEPEGHEGGDLPEGMTMGDTPPNPKAQG